MGETLTGYEDTGAVEGGQIFQVMAAIALGENLIASAAIQASKPLNLILMGKIVNPGYAMQAGVDWIGCADKLQEAMDELDDVTARFDTESWKDDSKDKFDDVVGKYKLQLLAGVLLAMAVGIMLIIASALLMVIIVLLTIVATIGFGFAVAIAAALAGVVSAAGAPEIKIVGESVVGIAMGLVTAMMTTWTIVQTTLAGVIAALVSGSALGQQAFAGNKDAMSDLKDATGDTMDTLQKKLGSILASQALRLKTKINAKNQEAQDNWKTNTQQKDPKGHRDSDYEGKHEDKGSYN